MWMPSYSYAYVRKISWTLKIQDVSATGYCGEKMEVEKSGSGEVRGGRLDILGKGASTHFLSGLREVDFARYLSKDIPAGAGRCFFFFGWLL